MSSQLDAIKARAELVAGKPDNREPTDKEWDALTDGAIHDVPALLAAVEAVLNMPGEVVECGYPLDSEWAYGYTAALVDVRAVIRQALGEGEQ